MAFGLLSIAHIVLAVFVIIELGITGWLVDVTLWTPSQYSFMLFNSIWSLLILLYIAALPIFFARLHIPVVALGLFALTTLFWFAGAIALAVFVGAADCHGAGYCHTAKAAVAFGFFIWAGFTALTVLEGLAWRRGGSVDNKTKVSTYPGA